ncbi:MAG: NUDIX domain-containing protein [Deltaproteobacteria bacterium]|nr:NUDIX domain-containing protein [Candidatus Zymogenaceae bacterium]
MDDGILIGAGALVEDEGGRILLVRHKAERGGFWQGTWILPGGMLAIGETIDEGIEREVAEETGLVIEIVESEVEPTERIVREDGRVTLHVVYIVKRARAIGGELAPASDVGEALWVDRDEMVVLREEIHPDTVRILGLFGIPV